MKLLKYIGLSFLGLSLNSCTDYLDNAPDDTLTMEMVLKPEPRTGSPGFITGFLTLTGVC